MKPAAYMILILLAAAGFALGEAGIEPARQVIESRCLGCHDSDTSKGGVDLEQLLSTRDLKAEKIAALWQKVDRVVAAGEMPPKKKKPLSAGQKAQVGDWYNSFYVLKEGMEHIGRSRLRRLSRYELINTLGDLLFVSLKQPYVYSPEFPAFLSSTLETILPPDAPGESGFYNDAEQLAGTRPPILKYSEAFDFALRIFSQDPEARQKVFGFKGASPRLGDAGARKILQDFMKRAWRGYSNPESEEVVLRAWRTARVKVAPVASLLHAI
ncbi:MAG: c-type cytochrome domain-containing protein [Planctomycetota bacterium]